MKKTIIIILAAMLAIVSTESITFASASRGTATGILDKKKKDIKTVTLKANIHCKNCQKKVEENIGFEKGVVGLEVSVEKRQVVIKYDAMKTDVATLLAAMKKIGFPATVLQN